MLEEFFIGEVRKMCSIVCSSSREDKTFKGRWIGRGAPIKGEKAKSSSHEDSHKTSSVKVQFNYLGEGNEGGENRRACEIPLV